MKFSIIVTTTGRPREIREFLRSLEKQTYKDLEVILGDQDKDLSLAGYLRGCPACFLILKGVVISSHETNRFS